VSITSTVLIERLLTPTQMVYFSAHSWSQGVHSLLLPGGGGEGVYVSYSSSVHQPLYTMFRESSHSCSRVVHSLLASGCPLNPARGIRSCSQGVHSFLLQGHLFIPYPSESIHNSFSKGIYLHLLPYSLPLPWCPLISTTPVNPYTPAFRVSIHSFFLCPLTPSLRVST
jgi:hypothetical protein